MNKPKLKRVKKKCEQLDMWLVLAEENDTKYENICDAFEMLQLERGYLKNEDD
jgi:hypothetical protein